jgi:hypothetical protein
MNQISAEYAVNVSRWLICSGLVLGLVLGGCGSSSHAVSSQNLPATSTAPPASAPATTTTAPAQTTTTTTSTTTSSSTAHHKPANVTAPPPAAGPHVPATYTIGATGTLTPPTISVPVGYTVQVTFIDHGSAKDTTVVHTPKPLQLMVAPGGDSFVLASRLPRGTYTIDVNGTARGSLVIGSAPGP